MKRWVFGLIGIVLLALLLPLIIATNEYEPDNVWQNATTILTNGSRQAHTFDTAGDVDYVNFTAVAGVQYVIETFNLSAPTITDTVMNLYDTDGTTLLDTNDDIELEDSICVQCSSRLVFDAIANGTYYVNISEYDNSADGSYQISILEQGRLIPSLVTYTTASNVTKNRVFSFTSSLQCLSADCYNVTATLDPEVQAIKLKQQNQGKAENKIHSMLEEQNNVDVIVIMKQKPLKTKTKKAALSSAQYSVLSNKGFEKKHEYTSFNGFSGKITKESLAELENNPDVEAIYFDREVHAFLDVSIPQINADEAWAKQVGGVNITGIGETICIIDTGIAYDHADFGSCAITSNINDGSCPKVVGGYDYVNTDNNPYDDNGHGSHVAGIAASQDSTYRGVAPSAKLAIVKVLNSAGSGSSSNLIAGIDWCVLNAVALNITAISMSLGITAEKHEFYCSASSEKTSIDAAVAAGVPVFIAAGNDDYTDGISDPACIQNATSVGSVNSADSLAENRGRILNLVAPGVSITATDFDGTHVAATGTSMSTPHAAALSLLLKQYAKLKFSRNLTAEQIKHNMATSGLMVYDSSSKLSFPRIDALTAINAKGIIPTTVGAKPFYSLTSNPHNASCLSHIALGETCNTAWQVNATGIIDIASDYPVDNQITKGNNLTFNCSISSPTYEFFVIYETDYKRNLSNKVNLTIEKNIANLTLYGSWDGAWHANETRQLSGNINSTSFNKTIIDDGTYTWSCMFYDNQSNFEWGINKTILIDNTPPSYFGLSYTALIELGDSQSISVNISDSYMSYANISYSSANYSMANSSYNFSYSYTPLSNATINFTVYALDAAGNSNSTTGGFIVNDTSDGVRIKSVSLANSTIAYGNNQTITAYIYDQWQPLSVYLDHNGTNTTMPNSSIANYSYTWTVSQCGTVAYKIFANNSLGTANTTNGTFTANNCCGNGVCDGSDTCSSCSADCGACAATPSSGGGGGGGGGGGISVSSNYASVVVKDISPANPAVFSINNPEIPVGEVKVDVASAIPQARMQITALKEQPSSVASVSSPVYRYLDISTGIQSKDVVSAEIAFNVDRSWLLENGILKDDVVLLRFNEGKW
ncbi:MAG: S8 family serine peptidase, partial [Candidatus Nanoarchaeia archaeon]